MTQEQETIESQATAIRLTATAIVIAEFALMQVTAKQDFKRRVNDAIRSCRKVQDYFVTHPNTTPETAEVFKKQFLSNEIIMLGELLKVCFDMNEEGIEEVIEAIKRNQ